MNRMLLSVIFLSLIALCTAQSITILNEGFEGTFPSGAWSLSGNPTWDDENAQANSGSWAAWCAGSSLSPGGNRYEDNMNAHMTYGPFSLADASTASLSFFAKLNSEENYDYFKVMLMYLRNGSWYSQELLSQSGTGQSSWRQYRYSLNDFVGNEQVKVSFRFSSDSSRRDFAGAWVDDVVIQKTVQQTAPTVINPLVFSLEEQSIPGNLNSSAAANWFSFSAVTDRTYILYSTGSLDTKIQVFEDDGVTEVASDDDGGDSTNFRLEFVPRTAGSYKIKIFGYNGATGSYTMNYNYREGGLAAPETILLTPSLSVQTIAGTLNNADSENVYRFQCIGGNLYNFYTTGNVDTKGFVYGESGTELLSDDDNGDGTNFLLSFRSSGNNYYTLKVRGYNGATGTYNLLYNYQNLEPDGYEPNNNASQFKRINPNANTQTLNLTLHDNDEDWFRFKGRAGTTYCFYTTGIVDTKAILYENNGTTQISENDDDGDGTNFRLVFTPSRTAQYKLKVFGYNGARGQYQLNYFK